MARRPNLSEQEMAEIRRLRWDTDLTLKQIARQVGVSAHCVWRITSGETKEPVRHKPRATPPKPQIPSRYTPEQIARMTARR